MDSRKPLTVGEIEALKSISADYDKHGVEWKEAMFVLEALPRLLSLLTPPPDAAVREAVEDIQRMLPKVKDSDGPWWQAFAEQAEVLLSYVRAVQTPRPSSEQHRVVRIAVINADLRGDTEESEALREAVEFSAEVRCGRLARGILRIGKRLRAMRADMASQTDALIAAMHAINDAGILMPDEVFNFVSTKRAVQAPRPSREQHRVVRIAVINADLRGDTEESEALRAAFPEAFAGEVTDKSGFECLVGLTFTRSEDAEDE